MINVTVKRATNCKDEQNKHFLLGGQVEALWFEFYKLWKIIWSVLRLFFYKGLNALWTEEYLDKSIIWLDIEEGTTACSKLTDCNFKQFMCLLWYDYFNFVYFRKVAISIFDLKQVSLWNIAKRHGHKNFLSCKLKLMALVMVYVKTDARGNFPTLTIPN